MKIVGLNDVKKTRTEMEGAKDVLKQIPIGKDDGAPNFSFRVFTIEPGGHTPYHTHPFEHVNYIIEGKGLVVNLSGDEMPVKKGDFALILPDEKHQYKNASETEDFIIICAVPIEYE